MANLNASNLSQTETKVVKFRVTSLAWVYDNTIQFDIEEDEGHFDKWNATAANLQSLAGKRFGTGSVLMASVVQGRQRPQLKLDLLKESPINFPFTISTKEGMTDYNGSPVKSKLIESFYWDGSERLNEKVLSRQAESHSGDHVNSVATAPQASPSAPAPEPVTAQQSPQVPEQAPPAPINKDYAGVVIQQAYQLMTAFRDNPYGQEVLQWLGDDIVKNEFMPTLRGIMVAVSTNAEDKYKQDPAVYTVNDSKFSTPAIVNPLSDLYEDDDIEAQDTFAEMQRNN